MNYEQLYNTIQSYTENQEALFLLNIPVFVQEAEKRIYNAVQIPALRKNVTANLTPLNQYLSLPSDYLATYSMAVIDSVGAYHYLLNKDVNFIREAYPIPTETGEPQHYALFGSQYGNINNLSLLLGPTPDQAYGVELHYFYYPPTIVQGQMTSFNSLLPGTQYTNGVYQNVLLSGGSGSGATADIVVRNQTVISCEITFGGNFYVAGDILTSTVIGASGSGFSITVDGISNADGTSWLGNNFDPVLFYGAMRESMLFMKQEADLVKYYEEKFVEALGMLSRLGTGLERGDAYRDGQARINQPNP